MNDSVIALLISITLILIWIIIFYFQTLDHGKWKNGVKKEYSLDSYGKLKTKITKRERCRKVKCNRQFTTSNRNRIYCSYHTSGKHKRRPKKKPVNKKLSDYETNLNERISNKLK